MKIILCPLLVFLYFISYGQYWSVVNSELKEVSVEVEFLLQGSPALDVSGCNTGDLRDDANCILSLEGINESHTLSLVASNEEFSIAGISTLDLVMVIRHIIGYKSLDKVADLISADVNYDGKVSASDIVLIRRLVLGLTDTWGDEVPEFRILTLESLQSPETNIDFSSFKAQWSKEDYPLPHLHVVAVKNGDVNNSASW